MIRNRQIPCVLIAAVFGVAAGACSSDNNNNTDTGRRNDATPRADAAAPDAMGTPDSGQVIDVGFPDSGVTDTGSDDTGIGTGDSMTDTGPRDTGMPDTGPRPDTGPADMGFRDTGVFDAGPPPECTGATVLTRTGSVTRYYGDNRSAPTISSLATPSCVQGNIGAARVFQFTPGTTSVLRVSTNYPRTNFDTVAWALDRCHIAGTTELGCNDDAQVPPHNLASTFRTPSERPAGTPIFVVVAGFSQMVGTATVGDFDLRITEMRRVAAGGMCDGSADPVDYCATGTSCTATSTRTGAPATCVTDGALNGRCRTTATPCDASLGCNASMRCVRTVPLGGACDPMRIRNVCVAPNQCVMMGPMATCAAQDYAESTIATPTWTDACTGGGMRIAVTDRDDGHSTTAIPIGFPFSFYRMAQTQIWPDTNGWIKFDTVPTNDLYQGSLPNAIAGTMIAGLWEDLVLQPPPASDICVRSIGTAPNRQLVIEWLDAFIFQHAAVHITFEVVLTETTNTIDMIYNRLEPTTGPDAMFTNGSVASVGLQLLTAPMMTRHVRHVGPISTMTGIRYTPN